MFRDEGKQLKVSLRSTGVVDVGLIAVQLGGGGHSHSAATMINKSEDKSLEELIKATIEKIEKCLNNA